MAEVIRDLDKLYQTVYIRRQSKLTPRELSSNLDEVLLKKCKSELEDKCAKEGFVRKGSVQMVRRSLGSMNEDQFTGDIHYHMLLSAQVCNPGMGMSVRAKVYQNDKIGILATFGPLQILLPRDVHKQKEIFGTVKRGDLLEITILDKKFKMDDKKIFCIGIYMNDREAIRQLLYGLAPEEVIDVQEPEEEEDGEIVVRRRKDIPPMLNNHNHDHNHDEDEEEEEEEEEEEFGEDDDDDDDDDEEAEDDEDDVDDDEDIE